MMKILFINPWTPDIYPVVSIGYLTSMVRKCLKDVEIHYVDMNNYSKFNIFVDFIFITAHSFAIPNIIKIMPYLKQNFTNSKIVCGGHHATALPNQMLEIGFDQVVCGPGEAAIISILHGGNKERIIYGLPTPPDNIPFPDYSNQDCLWRMPLDAINESGFPIISSRGCVFGCFYCASSTFCKRKWEARSPDNIVKEILENIERSGAKRFMFEDDNFTFKKDRAIDICKLIEKKVLSKYPDVSWECASRANVLSDQELCKALQKAQCYRVWLGIESGSKEILQRCHKGASPEQQMAGIRMANAHGIHTVAQFISGLPGECDRTVGETVEFIKLAKPSYITCNSAWVLPGTELYNISVGSGMNDSIYLTEVPFFTCEHQLGQLNEWSGRIMSSLN